MLAGDCGLVIPASRPDELASAMGGLMGDDLRRADLGRRARAKVASEYSLDVVLGRYVDLWARAVRQPLPR